MPVFFVHGVNVRNSDPGYANGVTARNELLQRLVLQPLAANHPPLRQIKIVGPYWGDSGVSFHWNMASLPTSATEAPERLEALDGKQSIADQATAETIAAIAREARPVTAENGHAPFAVEEALDANAGPVMRAARRDLLRLVESLLTPLLMAETELVGDACDAPSEGKLQAQLAIAAYAVAHDPAIQTQVRQAQTDKAVIDLLTRAVQAHFTAQVSAEMAAESGTTLDDAAVDGHEEAVIPAWLQGAQESIGSLFGRALAAPVEALATAFIEKQREPLHRNLTRFLGDIFVYLNARGAIDAPGPIVATVLDVLRTTPKGHPDEPMIVITHSMGGNILYDLITHYAPDLQIDVWISVGGQVAQFEEMKLSRSSDLALGAPQKVEKPSVGYWLNVYDPADILSFRVAPVFAGVDADEAYATGASVLKAHGEYFGRASFYELVRKHIEQAI